ncbi:MAG: class I SAM-dependent methyltransferase [Candidatus Omnitrophica bacterium]|nr:class I SAM-dependent methyltransferase [Candidatus Omnitrophota bacterium]
MGIYTLEKEKVYYSSDRREIAAIFTNSVSSVLDVGCGQGFLGKVLKAKGIKKVTGIEVNCEAAEIAKRNIDEVIVADIENTVFKFPAGSFDAIIFADVLEHLINPWQVLEKFKIFLKEDGFFLISIPNIRYYRVLLNLILKGKFQYEDQGILDITHLRFFTFKMLKKYMKDIDFEIIRVKRNFSGYISWLFNMVLFNALADFFTRQYIVLAKHKKHDR